MVESRAHHRRCPTVKLYRVADYKNLNGILRVEHHDEWRNASEAVFLTATQEVRGSDPNDAKDYLYFTHRLQGYLNTASYYKLCMLDQRNVLLDDEILDFLEFVPARLRADKVLYRRAMARAFPRLWQVPFASTSNLEHWGEVLAMSLPVRHSSSSLWMTDAVRSGSSSIGMHL